MIDGTGNSLLVATVKGSEGSAADVSADASDDSFASFLRDSAAEPYRSESGISAMADVELIAAIDLASNADSVEGVPARFSSLNSVSSEFKELHFVLMSLLASGDLEQQRIFHGSFLTQENREGQMAASGGARTSVVESVRPSAPAIVMGQTRHTNIVLAQNLSSQQERSLSRLGSKQSHYERFFSAVLPPRENLIVVVSNEEKRVFIRNFFDPSEALDRFREFNETAKGLLSGAPVYVNGDHVGDI